MPVSRKRKKKNVKGRPTQVKAAMSVKKKLDLLKWLDEEGKRLEAEQNQKEN